MSTFSPLNSEFMTIINEGGSEILTSFLLGVDRIDSSMNLICLAILLAAVITILFAITNIVVEKCTGNPLLNKHFIITTGIPLLIFISCGTYFIAKTPHIKDYGLRLAPSKEAIAKIENLGYYEIDSVAKILTDLGCFKSDELKSSKKCSNELQAVILRKSAVAYSSKEAVSHMQYLTDYWIYESMQGNSKASELIGLVRQKDLQAGMLLEEKLTYRIANTGSTPQTNFDFVKKFYTGAEALKDSCGSLSQNNCNIIKAVYVNEVKKLAGEAISDSNISKENYLLALEKAKTL